jgi:hypothetical protein
MTVCGREEGGGRREVEGREERRTEEKEVREEGVEEDIIRISLEGGMRDGEREDGGMRDEEG